MDSILGCTTPGDIAMQLWRIHIKPDAQKGIDPVDFCLQRNIAAIGWAVSRSPTSKDDYRSLVEAEYPAHFSESWPNWRRSWCPAANAILDHINNGDLIWTRNQQAKYFLGKIDGDWQYNGSTEHTDADVINIRPCQWIEVGLMDNVPGSVINSLNRRAAVQRVVDTNALLYSQYLHAKLTAQHFTPPDEKRNVDVLQLLSADDLEDVVALFLQATKGYRLYPTTCKLSTKAIECLFVSPESGERIGMQVKGGHEPVDQDVYSTFGHLVYLFSASGTYLGNSHAHVRCLSPDEVRTFTIEHRKTMPARIQRWIDFAQEYQ